jgi:hypothetical protein
MLCGRRAAVLLVAGVLEVEVVALGMEVVALEVEVVALEVEVAVALEGAVAVALDEICDARHPATRSNSRVW